MASLPSDRVLARVAAQRDAMIKLQRLLTATPAIGPENGGGGEWDQAQALVAWLAQLGLPEPVDLSAVDARVPAGKRPNLLVTCPGSSPERLWIIAHLDVVPPGDEAEWSSPPFKLVEDGEFLVGRGVEDNQQSLVASLFALRSLLDEGVVPARTVKLLFVSDEETGSAFGMQYLLGNYDLFHPDDLVLVPDGGGPDGSLIEVAEKSLLWLKIHTRGRQGHASFPGSGINAFVAGSHLVGRLAELERELSRHNPLFDPSHSTFTPTKKEANVPNVNTIPGEDVFYVDARILPDEDVDAVLGLVRGRCREIEQRFGVSVEVTIQVHDPSPPTRLDTPLIPRLARAIERVYGVRGVPRGIGSSTVAAFLRRARLDTVVWSRVEGAAHFPNERCRISNMIGDSQVMALLMMGGS